MDWSSLKMKSETHTHISWYKVICPAKPKIKLKSVRITESGACSLLHSAFAKK